MPSQWEGLTEDGRELYGRFRHGCGYACVENTPGSGVFDNAHTMVSFESPGDRWAGNMTDSQFRKILLVAGVTFDGEIALEHDYHACQTPDAPDVLLTLTFPTPEPDA